MRSGGMLLKPSSMTRTGRGVDFMRCRLESVHTALPRRRSDKGPVNMLRVAEEFQRMQAVVNGGAEHA